ncbi:prenyltransferase/squalene oxidase repeat-containing protein [Streptomyces sp. NPDC044571]|uniref:prenyltransferase/squalene oxidase repeat-containing protein n=1 Tax=Streptomyces sp. NPDC044571 TaxID=3155371 RepID=UPI0033DA622E
MPEAPTQPMSAAHDTDAAALLAATAGDPWGLVAPSVYDTARLVSLAPRLGGHEQRVAYLLNEQNEDGSWGAPDGYGLVPTLSAVEALLRELARTGAASAPKRREETAAACAAGLDALQGSLLDGEVPDTIGVEFVGPALLADINAHLAALPPGATDKLGPWSGAALSSAAPDLDGALLAHVRTLAGQDALPEKLWHSLEAFTRDGACGARPHAGSVGCSPAATAAWLGGAPERDTEAAAYLDAVQARFGGPVPSITPIVYFERAWVLNSLAASGLDYQVPAELRDSLEAGLTETGVPAAPGLPTDSDDTAAVLFALAQHGRPHRPDSLVHFRRDGYFSCFGVERTPSTSTNAHILEALGHYAAIRPQEADDYAADIAMITTWLLANQLADGSWTDKWHASAYYATACCALALAEYGTGPAAREAAARAVRWALETQRPDGSWGRWQGTTEETSYMVQLVLRAAAPQDRTTAVAAAERGCAWLTEYDDPAGYPGLWHDKDIYAPVTVIRAARLAALALGRAASGGAR